MPWRYDFGICLWKMQQEQNRNSIKITFASSKKHRADLKQLVWPLAGSSDSAFPLFQRAYSCNAADGTTFFEKQWYNLIGLLLGYMDFPGVADSKIVTATNMACPRQRGIFCRTGSHV